MNGPVLTPAQVDAVARALARAQLIWMIGEQGVMAINPKLVTDTFEKVWNSARVEDQTARRSARWVAEAILRDKDVRRELQLDLGNQVAT